MERDYSPSESHSVPATKAVVSGAVTGVGSRVQEEAAPQDHSTEVDTASAKSLCLFQPFVWVEEANIRILS